VLFNIQPERSGGMCSLNASHGKKNTPRFYLGATAKKKKKIAGLGRGISFIWLFETRSLCSPGCPGRSVDPTGLTCTDICLPLPLPLPLPLKGRIEDTPSSGSVVLNFFAAFLHGILYFEMTVQCLPDPYLLSLSNSLLTL